MGVLKKAKGFVKKTVTKPIAKVLDKVIPNEVKPFLPYAAAVFPFLAPTAFGTLASTMPGFGIQNAFLRLAAQRGLAGSGLNIFSQLAQEGSEGDINLTRAAIAGIPAALATPGLSENLGVQSQLITEGAADPTAFGTQLKSGSLDLLSKAAGAAEKGASADLFSIGKAKAIATPLSLEGTFDAVEFAKQAEADYLAELAEFNRLAGEEQEASDADRRAAITASMLRANFTQDVIDDTLDQLGLLLKDGGRVGYQTGGRASLQDFQNALRSVGTGTTYQQQAQAKDFARNEANRMLTDAFRSGNQANLQSIFQGVGGLGSLAGLQFDRNRGRITGAPALGRGRDQIIEAMASQMLNYPVAGGSARPTKSPLQLKIEENQRIYDEYIKNNPPSIGLITPGQIPTQPKPEYEQQALLDQLTMLTPEEALAGETFDTLSDIDQYNFAQAFPQFQPQLRDPTYVSPYGLDPRQTFSRRYGIKDGGIASFKEGGIMDLGGKEMDMRGGGFIPIGAKERADDVPARLSKNEFVMTADAVRAAGGGSVNKGAKRMYNLMHKLEARA